MKTLGLSLRPLALTLAWSFAASGAAAPAPPPLPKGAPTYESQHGLAYFQRYERPLARPRATVGRASPVLVRQYDGLFHFQRYECRARRGGCHDFRR